MLVLVLIKPLEIRLLDVNYYQHQFAAQGIGRTFYIQIGLFLTSQIIEFVLYWTVMIELTFADL